MCPSYCRQIGMGVAARDEDVMWCAMSQVSVDTVIWCCVYRETTSCIDIREALVTRKCR